MELVSYKFIQLAQRLRTLDALTNFETVWLPFIKELTLTKEEAEDHQSYSISLDLCPRPEKALYFLEKFNLGVNDEIDEASQLPEREKEEEYLYLLKTAIDDGELDHSSFFDFDVVDNLFEMDLSYNSKVYLHAQTIKDTKEWIEDRLSSTYPDYRNLFFVIKCLTEGNF